MNRNGLILWQGASALDGAPVVLIATGLRAKSTNSKTGAMVQTYILRADVDPVAAVRSGADASICGDCPHRGNGFSGRTCYVNVGQGALGVYRAFRRGSYPQATDAADVIAAGAGRMVRIGTYGDPAAVPARVWQDLTAQASGWTGYTHQWRQLAASPLRDLVMASADCPEDAREAHALGYRTFRVTRTASEPSVGREVACPASEEAGRKLTCETCGACSGTASGRRGSIRIVAHGAMASAANLAALDARLIARG
jgi:hypothetical protein